MSNILNTLTLILRASIVSFLVIGTYYIFGNISLFFLIENQDYNNSLSPLKAQFISFVFFGLVIGNSIHRLKSTYLYVHSREYRKTIILSSLLLIGILIIPSIFVLFYYNYPVIISLFFSFFVCFSTAQFFIHRNIIVSTITAFALFIIMLHYAYIFELSILMFGCIFLSAIQLYFSFKQNLDQKQKNQSNKENPENVADTIHLNHKINIWIMQFIESITKNKVNIHKSGNLIVAISNPVSRFNLVVIIPFIFLMALTPMKYEMIAGVSALAIVPIYLMTALTISSYTAIKSIKSQLKSISHLYAQRQHQKFKNRILFLLDMKLLKDSLLIAVVSFLIIYLFSIENNYTKMFMVLLSIMLTVLTFSPLLIRKLSNIIYIQWLISIPIMVIGIINIQWCLNHSPQDLISTPVFLYLFGLLAIRLIGQKIWNNFRFEEFMR